MSMFLRGNTLVNLTIFASVKMLVARRVFHTIVVSQDGSCSVNECGVWSRLLLLVVGRHGGSHEAMTYCVPETEEDVSRSVLGPPLWRWC